MDTLKEVHQDPTKCGNREEYIRNKEVLQKKVCKGEANYEKQKDFSK